MERLFSAELCKAVTDFYPDYFTFDEEEWFSKPLDNFAYVEGENVGFGERKQSGHFEVHFCFHSARGRQAIDLTKRMLKQLCEDSQLTSCVGLIEQNNKKARWLIRQVGFQSLGLTTTKNGICEMFYYTNTEKD